MPEKFLDCPYIISLLDEVCCKTLAESMHRCLFVDACFECGIFERPLQGRGMHMMPAYGIGMRVICKYELIPLLR